MHGLLKSLFCCNKKTKPHSYLGTFLEFAGPTWLELWKSQGSNSSVWQVQISIGAWLGLLPPAPPPFPQAISFGQLETTQKPRQLWGDLLSLVSMEHDSLTKPMRGLICFSNKHVWATNPRGGRLAQWACRGLTTRTSFWAQGTDAKRKPNMWNIDCCGPATVGRTKKQTCGI